MLIDSISCPWVRFRVLFAGLQKEEDKRLMAKEAFLCVIANYNAFSFQKLKMLDHVSDIYPNVVEALSDGEMFESFQYLCREMSRRKEIVSIAELEWIRKYVGNATIRAQSEKLIYLRFLRASSHWDKMRHEFDWTISENDKTWLVRDVLKENIGSKRKMELAKEFGEPIGRFVNAYYRKLLYDRHYDQAEALGVNDQDLVVDVIISNINNGYYQDALSIAKRFLSERDDIVSEIEQIIAAFNN